MFGFGIDDWSSVVNSFDRGVKVIIADAEDDRHASVRKPCFWQQSLASFLIAFIHQCMQSSESLDIFRRRLKTELFERSYNW